LRYEVTIEYDDKARFTEESVAFPISSMLQEGAKVTVISRISKDWLYGEYNGRKGQFPANYVNILPRNV
jgi:hypothetical protein